MSLTTSLVEQIRNAKNFNSFCSSYHLTTTQEEQFVTYAALLIEHGSTFNITTILSPSSIIRRHFEDSIILAQAYDLKQVKKIADIGAGGGFPSIPLKIIAPWLDLYLIEVSFKKSQFLATLIEQLQLDNTQVCMLDWRTFLRKTDYSIDLFVARASLETLELLRLFKPSSPYRNAQLIYWASQHWQPSVQENHFVYKEFVYTIDTTRKLIFFGLKE